ncbi:hypothetical protein HAX54_010188 [Datura stramonium]|uniref:RING-type domain-containing protein n=1 Tax=Datura stramonium TaxID=4076 RepID=A0ABS8THR7_DATST|nr:hypothetical protein [Datura stramonium]
MQVYINQNPKFTYELEKPIRRPGFNSSSEPKFIQINFFCINHHNWNSRKRPPNPNMVVKSPKISTCITMEVHEFASNDKARETIYKVLKNWHASDVNCKKILEELNEMAHKSRDCLVLVDGRPALQLTVKVTLFNHYVSMGKKNSNDMITSTSGGGNCLLCQNELVGDSKVTKMSCSHMFHINCIKAWLGENNGCPSCAANVNDLDDMISSMQL